MICNSCGSFFPDDQPNCPQCGAQAPQIGMQQATQPYQSPVIQQSVVNAAPTVRKNGSATAGLILGIISLVFCWIPYIGVLLAIIGLIFAIIGVAKKNVGSKGKAVVGIVLAGISLLIGSSITNAVSNASAKPTQSESTTVVSTTQATTTTVNETTTEVTTSEETTSEAATIEETKNSTSATEATTTAAKTAELDKAAFKKTCTTLNYKELARYPEKYKGKNFKYICYVSSVRQGGLFTGYQKYYITYTFDIVKARKYVKKKWYKNIQAAGWSCYDANQCVYLLDNRDETDPTYVKVLDSDLLVVYGTFNGLTSTKNVLTGETSEQVSLDIKYVDILKK